MNYGRKYTCVCVYIITRSWCHDTRESAYSSSSTKSYYDPGDAKKPTTVYLTYMYIQYILWNAVYIIICNRGIPIIYTHVRLMYGCYSRTIYTIIIISTFLFYIIYRRSIALYYKNTILHYNIII